MSARSKQPSALPPEERTDQVLRWAEKVAADDSYRREGLYPHFLTLTNRYAALLKRFQKIAKISDGFQLSLKEVNAHLDDAARTDYLTGLPNRRDIIENIAREISRTERHGTPFSVIVADIDHFKVFNDSYGHQAGDLVLKAVADSLRRSLRREDFCARWGGEEFLICLPETVAASALAVAEKLRANVEGVAVTYDGAELGVTVSLGVSTHSDGESFNDVIRAADEAMLKAKRMGRNTVAGGSPT